MSDIESTMPKGREAILDAVIAVVAKRGLRGLTFRSLATEAKVSPTLAAHHFGTRDVLIAEALKWCTNRAVDSTHLRNFASSGSEYETALTESLVSESDLHAFQLEMILEAKRRPELQPAVKELYSTYLQAMRMGPEEMELQNVSQASLRAVFACIDGLILQYLGGAITLDEFSESALLIRNLIVDQPE